MRPRLFASACVVAAIAQASAKPSFDDVGYLVSDETGVGRRFDGIGGLSGGGATSRLLPTYDPVLQSQILDYLFLPNFGASLHILKVEIGGDAQSTDGSETSHMHDPWHEEYGVGYEFWLMTEAKKRNPNIKLYGLPWAFPQWVSCQTNGQPSLTNCSNWPYTFPQQTATYVVKWVLGAQNTYNLTLDYLGIWNERQFDATYIKTLRSTLDDNGLQHVQIVAADGNWDIASAVLSDPELAAAVSILGAHYPGTVSTPQAMQTGKQLWASEDDSTFNNNVGTGCWVRILNQNFVNGQMTGTICWNLIASYAKGFDWYRASIMTALQPYSGAYTVAPMVWATAHTTQFTQPGWNYLSVGSGSGLLSHGGSYVSIVSPDASEFTLIVEKMSRDHSTCVRPDLPDYSVSAENATFRLQGSFASITKLYVWYSHFAFGIGDTQVEFQQLTPVTVVNGVFSYNISVDSLYTFTTVSTGNKGQYPAPPQPTLFPKAHVDDYNACPISQEPAYWTDMNGAFECQDSNDPAHGIILRQMAPLRSITWGDDTIPHSLWAGGRDFADISYWHDVFIPSADSSAWIGVRCQGEDTTNGIIWAWDSQGNWNVSFSILQLVTGIAPLAKGAFSGGFGPGQWHTFRLDVNGTLAQGWMDSQLIWSLNVSSAPARGHIAIGSIRYGDFPSFDNLQLYTTQVECGSTKPVVGSPISMVQCSSEVGPSPSSSFDFYPITADNKTGVFALRSSPSLCIAMVPTSQPEGQTLPFSVQLATCNKADANQQWSLNYTTPYETLISNAPSGRCLDIYQTIAEIGYEIDAWPCNTQAFYYDYLPGEIINIGDTVCLGVC